MNTDIKKVNRAFQLDQSDVSEIIQMALSDHIAFDDIFTQFGLKENDVKKIMRNNLKTGSYRTWRKRVREFSARREFYK
jgi:uncharacterized protein (TIGR03643 family)